ncbi:MAG: S9 family peptidase [Xanthomonadales bacterium]|nr:S9 family peptidase [Xanthomonadales bacterium]
MTSLADALSLERIFDEPSLDGPVLRQPKLSPDGSRVTFLREKDSDAEQLDLWEYNLAAGKTRMLVDSKVLQPEPEALSDEEKARRERQRIAGLRGIVDYQWSPTGTGLLFPLGGDLYYYDLETGKPLRLTASEAFVTDPKVSPEGDFVAFICDQDLYVVELETGDERRLTRDGGGTLKNGMAEFIAQEEMDRDSGYWWSPDGKRIAFLQVDESPVSVTQRYEIHADEFKVIDQRYPYAGTSNVTYRLGIITLASGETRWVDLGREKDIYVPRVDWARPDLLTFQVQNREQTRLELRAFDLQSGGITVLLAETADTWVNLHSDLRILEQEPLFLWSSERTGFRHLYLYGLDGTLQGALTGGPWQVDRVEGVDEASGQVYFTATQHSPLERHLYRVDLDPETTEEPTRLTDRPGTHVIAMSESADVYVDTFSTRDQPPQVSLYAADGERIAWLLENSLSGDHPYLPFLGGHRPTEFGTLEAEDGQRLYYRLTRPEGAPGEHFPAIVHVYGGPHVQMVADSWGRRILIEQYLARQGFVVFSLDNRGSARRGTAFENPLNRAMGGVEVTDQAAGARFLGGLEFVDPERIGVMGGSYGGYMVLHLMFRHPELFRVGVSMAPVTDWSTYDTHYTERYMGTPTDNAEGYARSSVFPYSEGFSNRLLVIHGMADDNVLFTHSTRLFEHLQKQGVLFDAMPYPGAKHGISGQASQTHLYRTLFRYFRDHLGGTESR